MTVRLQLMVPALSPRARRGVLGAGDGLDQRGQEAVLRCARRWPDDVMTTCSPERACVQTAALVGLDAVVDQAVRDWDLGAWNGKLLTEIAATSPQDLERWTTDPSFTSPGGESLRQLGSRVTDWLDRLETDENRHVVTVATPAVVRATLVSVLGAPMATFWRLDLEPLASVHISLRPGRRAVRWSAGDASD